jgi:hypothetical protein
VVVVVVAVDGVVAVVAGEIVESVWKWCVAAVVVAVIAVVVCMTGVVVFVWVLMQ